MTGLLDWSANADAAGLARLRGVVDEVVIQTYQDHRTIPGCEAYLASLARLPIPYRVAWCKAGNGEPAGAGDRPQFRGYVVFPLS